MSVNARMLAEELKSLTVFRSLLNDEVVESLARFLDDMEFKKNEETLVDDYCDFVYLLYDHDVNLTGYIYRLVINDENVFVRFKCRQLDVPEQIEKSVRRELAILEQVAKLKSRDLIGDNVNLSLPEWATEDINFTERYLERTEHIERYGYGIFADNYAFYLRDDELVPVYNPDTISLDDLSGYEDEKQKVIDNTEALLQGKPAANVLLSGDAGTGKSSTVKAVVNRFKDEGLRIVEIRKDQLALLPKVIDELDGNPLKFILFIDDLSFNAADDNYSALKAMLEGTVSAKKKNIAIYATSNRRHIVKETFGDRSGDEIHRNDTIQELTSLSDRFGLCITFVKPNKQLYIDIVENLARQEGIVVCDELVRDAEKFALNKGGRSARVARQFIDSCLSK